MFSVRFIEWTFNKKLTIKSAGMVELARGCAGIAILAKDGFPVDWAKKNRDFSGCGFFVFFYVFTQCYMFCTLYISCMPYLFIFSRGELRNTNNGHGMCTCNITTSHDYAITTFYSIAILEFFYCFIDSIYICAWGVEWNGGDTSI